jgi:hypothetical protein
MNRKHPAVTADDIGPELAPLHRRGFLKCALSLGSLALLTGCDRRACRARDRHQLFRGLAFLRARGDQLQKKNLHAREQDHPDVARRHGAARHIRAGLIPNLGSPAPRLL